MSSKKTQTGKITAQQKFYANCKKPHTEYMISGCNPLSKKVVMLVGQKFEVNTHKDALLYVSILKAARCSKLTLQKYVNGDLISAISI